MLLLQLRDFYGPLLACVTATKSAYDAMVSVTCCRLPSHLRPILAQRIGCLQLTRLTGTALAACSAPLQLRMTACVPPVHKPRQGHLLPHTTM
jgi:hypothetical protein